MAGPLHVDIDQAIVGKLKSPKIITLVGSFDDRLSNSEIRFFFFMLFPSGEFGLRYIVTSLTLLSL